MDSDKEEWEKILKAHEEERQKFTSRNAELESEVQRLKDEIASSSTERETREKMLNAQLANAHGAQILAEKELAAEKSQVVAYREEVTRLRETSTSQNEEIERLKMQLAQSNKERDEAKLLNARLTEERNEAQAARTEAEHELADMRAKIDDTLDGFYFRCVVGKGSLDFLGDQFPVTLAGVWEKVLAEFAEFGATDEQMQEFYLDEKSRQALAQGRIELAEQRAQVETAMKMSLEHVTVPQPDTALEHEAHTSSDKDGSEYAQGFEVQTRIPPPTGNFLDEALPKDGSYDSFGIEELFADYERVDSPYVPRSPDLLGTTDFSLSPFLVTDTAAEEHTIPAQAQQHTLQTTPQSQPGSQEPKIAALDDTEDTNLSQDFVAEEHGGESTGGMKTPEQSAKGKEKDSGSSSKKESSKDKGKKKTVSKRRKHIIGTGDEEEEEQEELDAGTTATVPPTTRRRKINIKLDSESKGGKKK